MDHYIVTDKVSTGQVVERDDFCTGRLWKDFVWELRVEVKLRCAKAMQNVFSKANHLSDSIKKGKGAHA